MTEQRPPGGLPVSGSPKKKRSPGDLARDARRLAALLERKAAERQGAWAEGGHPNVAFSTTRSLDDLHRTKRRLRRHVYSHVPDLEGTEVKRHQPRLGA